MGWQSCHLRLSKQSQRNWAPLAGAALFLAIGLWLSITVRYLSWDEPWILQVVMRMQAGETLYRDIWYMATPLGVYLTLGMTKLLGIEVWVIKLSVVFSCLYAYLVSVRITRQITGVQDYDIFFAAALLLYGLPVTAGLYQPLATLFLLLCFDIIVRWNGMWWKHKTPNGRMLAMPVLVGVSAGLCFATKQNIGIYALGASLVALWVGSNERVTSARMPGVQANTLSNVSWYACWLYVLIGFTLVVTVIMLPVLWSGGMEKFLDYGFINQHVYLRLAGISYLDGVQRFLLVFTVRPLITMVLEVFESQVVLLPMIATIGLLLTLGFIGKSERRQVVVMICFLVASWLSIYPRADLIHIVFATPGFLIAAIYAWHVIKARMAAALARLLSILLWLMVLTGISLKLLVSYRDVTSPAYVWADLPHLRYKLLSASEQVSIRHQAQWLAAHTAGESLLMLSPDASLYYLISGWKNPTPFDFPLESAFGTSGVTEVMSALEQRRIRAVCMQKIAWPLAPVELERYVESTLRRDGNAGSCNLYRVRE